MTGFLLRSYDSNVKVRRRVARKQHLCQWGDCRRINPGDVYVESTSFPGHDSGYATSAGHPVRMALCARCALGYGYDLDIPYDQLCREGLL
jgi:hypothetical protein